MFLPLRDENPTTRPPVFTVALIVANAGAFLYQLFGAGDELVLNHGLVPARIVGADWAASSTLFTSMFLHGGFLHLGGNLLYLWIFGNNIEDVLGHGKFLVFYLLAGLGGHAGHLLTNAGSTIPTIGASGAISGILGAYLLRFPQAHIQSLLFFVFFVRLIRAPAAFVIGWWLLMQVLGGVSAFGVTKGGGIAWFEHLGGFAVGITLFWLWSPGRPRRVP